MLNVILTLVFDTKIPRSTQKYMVRHKNARIDTKMPYLASINALIESFFSFLSFYQNIFISCQGERIRNICKAWYQKLLSANGHMFTSGLCKVGTQNDSRDNSRASAKQLSHNKNCRFKLEYIDMQPNHTLSVENIVENRYTWTELPAVERAFHSRQISGTRSKSRLHESELWRWQ